MCSGARRVIFGCVCMSVCLSSSLCVCTCVCVCVPMCLYIRACVRLDRLSTEAAAWKLNHIVRKCVLVSIMGHVNPPRMFCHWGRRLDRLRSAEIDPGGGGTFEAKLVPAKPLQKSNPHGGRGLLHGTMPQKTATMRRCECLSKASTQKLCIMLCISYSVQADPPLPTKHRI